MIIVSSDMSSFKVLRWRIDDKNGKIYKNINKRPHKVH